MRVSIVVPALDEAPGIVTTLDALQPLRAAGHEVIVVDGGSADATAALAAPRADRVLVAPKGRASQMNAGAAAATGDVLLFLHADSSLSPAGVAALLRELTRSGRRWGRFDVTIAGRFRVLKLVAAMMNARSRLTGIATGDQGIFVERALFDALGGFPDQPLMEDIELSRRLKRAAGRPLCLRERVATSARRWERRGVWRTIVSMWRWRFLYWLGADAARLALEYRTDLRAPPITLQIFARSPIAGQVKTRLARTIGDAAAARHYADLVERTLATAVAAQAAGVVQCVELWCAPDEYAPGFAAWRDRYGVTLRTQAGDDLGARMRNALDSALERGSPAILIGTDCPLLDRAYLAQAAAALVEHDAVFGPVEDGGYVLVGLRRRVDAFTGIPWSSPATMAATREKLHAQNIGWKELPTLWDVDLPADLARWLALAPGSGAPASASSAAVE